MAGQEAGRAYIYSGKDGSVLLTLSGERAGDAFGSAVAGFADKEHIFLIVGAPNAGPKQTGRTYVYDALSSKPTFSIEADETGVALGATFLPVPSEWMATVCRTLTRPTGRTLQKAHQRAESTYIPENTATVS